jgi:nucleotide-binding universal stress UspA family protein
MFARILAATDFSAPSDAALAQARRLAETTGATLHVLHVVDNMFMRVVLADPRDYETAARRQLQERVSSGDHETPAVLAVERSDEPADEITSYARIHDIDLIVMGTHGRGRIAHLLLGSVAEKVTRIAPCPVLTLREAPPAPRTERLRILVPTDFSASADTALGCAKRLAAKVGGSIRMLHVMEHTAVGAALGSEMYVPEPEIQTERIANVRIQLSRRILADSRSRVRITSDIVFGPTGATIAAYAGDAGFDIIVMGTRGRGGLAHLLMGSVAESVIRTAPCPVLTVKAGVAAGHAQPADAAAVAVAAAV